MPTRDGSAFTTSTAKDATVEQSPVEKKECEMGRLCAVNEEEVRDLFEGKSRKRTSWDPVNDKERAKKLRMLQLKANEVDVEVVGEGGEDDSSKGEQREQKTNDSHKTNSQPGGKSRAVMQHQEVVSDLQEQGRGAEIMQAIEGTNKDEPARWTKDADRLRRWLEKADELAQRNNTATVLEVSWNVMTQMKREGAGKRVEVTRSRPR